MAEQQPAPAPAKKTTLGMEPNLEGLLCYAGWWVTGIVFFVIEKDSKFVRFHAMQSIATFIPIQILFIILPFILRGSGIWGLLNSLLWVASVILWLVLMLQAYSGKEFKLPIVGDFAASQVK